MDFVEKFLKWLTSKDIMDAKTYKRRQEYMKLQGDLRQAQQKMDSLRRLVLNMQSHGEPSHDS